MLHGIKQLSCDVPDPLPNIVFSGTLIAPEISTIYQKYIKFIAESDSLPYIVFKNASDDERFSVVYKRHDGGYGLIEDA